MTERGDAAKAAIKAIDPLLEGHDLAVQGAVLAQLLAHWLMRHNRQERTLVLDLHLAGVRDSWARREKEEG